MADTCPDCGRPKAPVNWCDHDSIYEDGQCPGLTITRLRARVAELEQAHSGQRALAEGWAQLREQKQAIRAMAWEEGHQATGPYAENPYVQAKPVEREAGEPLDVDGHAR